MLLHQETTDLIIKCFYKVYNELGFGFLEKVYENAMLIELRANGLIAPKQVPVEVFYEGILVGSYFADIIVEDKIIIELKAGEGLLVEEHELQLINYLKATKMEVGLLLFFGKKPQFKRKIFTNNNKNQF
ncbi:GxxExxY protein [Ferruginibacter paludis]|uniref:GxxExxY protein n=1 Tax=Ferruginibacter paludis TaxID=1310417 RepID=UPI0025B39F5A|nr:GxxExxY protein [Ferruginibacter paludis]MDN3656619.1 GxxExxY protein [Ferruginibacter paludis]